MHAGPGLGKTVHRVLTWVVDRSCATGPAHGPPRPPTSPSADSLQPRRVTVRRIFERRAVLHAARWRATANKVGRFAVVTDAAMATPSERTHRATPQSTLAPATALVGPINQMVSIAPCPPRSVTEPGCVGTPGFDGGLLDPVSGHRKVTGRGRGGEREGRLPAGDWKRDRRPRWPRDDTGQSSPAWHRWLARRQPRQARIRRLKTPWHPTRRLAPLARCWHRSAR